VPDQAYQALVGATSELVRSRVTAGKTGALPELEDTLVAFHLAVLAGQPWPASPVPLRSSADHQDQADSERRLVPPPAAHSAS
jgi:hypothetical protein